ncbi:SGNH family hydrolase [Alsobacter sp. KACC 23698]|uniref:SGNH family hydrolase n=1 Tax=Alsobacter sp. KACC 23698 TaxID=3149229 RepID=A0AAU7JC88_9HYPH
MQSLSALVARLFVLVALAAAALPGAVPEARAQPDDRFPLQFTPQMAPSRQQFRRVRPTPPPAPRAERRRAPPPAAATMVIRDAPEKPAIEPTAFVMVFGDVMAELVANGLADAFDDNPDVRVSKRTVSSSGLVRDDFFDWRKTMREMLASEKITHAVVVLGSNDRQTLKDASGTALEPMSDAWKEAYAGRVEEIGRAFADKNVPLFWVGMPIMESPRFTADMVALNEIFRSAARKTGAIYIDLFEPFADAKNRYSSFGPDLAGDTVKLRTSDGVHFTKAGARKAAHFIEVEIRRSLDQRAPAIVAVPGADPDDPASHDPSLQPGGVERAIDQAVLRGLDGLPPAPLTIPQRPVAGPILPLTGPESAQGGALVAGVSRKPSTEAGQLVERALLRGQVPDPKPGRADDFRWPDAR